MRGAWRVCFNVRKINNQKGVIKPVKLSTSKLRNTRHTGSLVHWPNHGKIIKPLAGQVSNRLGTIPLKHLLKNMTRNIMTSSTQMTRYSVI